MGEQRRARRRAAALGLTLFVLAATITGLVSALVRTAAHNDAKEQFEQSARQIDKAVQNEVNRYLEKLRDIGSYVANVDASSAGARDFKRYVEGTQIFDQLPAVSGVVFLQRIEPGDYERTIEAYKAKDPSFTQVPMPAPADGTPRYLLTQWVASPDTKLDLPLYTDVSSITSLTSVMEAAGTRRIGAAGSFQNDPFIKKVAEQTKFPLMDQLLALDFFIGLPVYAPSDGQGNRSSEPLGWIAAPVGKFDSVVSAAGRDAPEGFGLNLTMDLTKVMESENQAVTRGADRKGTAGNAEDAAFTYRTAFEPEGITFRLAIWSQADADAIPVTVPLTLAGGLLASGLAGVIMFMRVRAHAREREYATELAEREEFQGEILDSVTSPMVVLDGNGQILRTNPAWTQLLSSPAHTPAAEAADHGDTTAADAAPVSASVEYLSAMKPYVRTSHEELADALWEVLRGDSETMETDVAFEDVQHRRWYSVRATRLRGRRGGAVVIHADITERKRSHEDLELKATRDNLTGLLNRMAFMTELEAALRQARTNETSVGLIYLDLDGFKPINDTYGHAAGDNVLREVARRITAAVRTSDRVARVGGDEFVILVHPVPESRVVESTATRILRALEKPVHLDESRTSGLTGNVLASIGVAFTEAPLDTSGADLLERADQAMYVSKQRGGARVTVAS